MTLAFVAALSTGTVCGVASAEDELPPATPTGLQAKAVSATQINLTWNAAADNVKVMGYEVFANGAMVARIFTNSYAHAGLTPGAKYAYRVNAFDYSYNHSGLTPTAAVAQTLASAAPGAGAGANFYCSFVNSPEDCGFQEQAKVDGRATLTSVSRDGGTGVRLHTEPGDSNVYGSGSAERNDLSLPPGTTGCYQGQQQWWAHSVYFPADYVVPPATGGWNWGLVFDFHHTGSTGQANFQIVSHATGLSFWVAGGPNVVTGPGQPGFYSAPIGPVVKNTWYDFVYNVRWSAGSDGYFQAWVNGALKMDYRGPTLYSGQNCYLKLVNYHTAVGQPVSVIHDRIVRGPTALSVTNRPLEGEVTLSNGNLVALP